MPTYFFDIQEGDTLITDPEGVRLADAEAARRHAITGARSLLSAAVTEGRLPLNDAIVVTDAQRRPIMTVLFGHTVGKFALTSCAANWLSEQLVPSVLLIMAA